MLWAYIDQNDRKKRLRFIFAGKEFYQPFEKIKRKGSYTVWPATNLSTYRRIFNDAKNKL